MIYSSSFFFTPVTWLALELFLCCLFVSILESFSQIICDLSRASPAWHPPTLRWTGFSRCPPWPSTFPWQATTEDLWQSLRPRPTLAPLLFWWGSSRMTCVKGRYLNHYSHHILVTRWGFIKGNRSWSLLCKWHEPVLLGLCENEVISISPLPWFMKGKGSSPTSKDFWWHLTRVQMKSVL